MIITKTEPLWQTDWESDYLARPEVAKFSMKSSSGELLALAAYHISGRKAYVYIVYVESAPGSGPKHFMLADEDAWRLFSKYPEEEDA